MGTGHLPSFIHLRVRSALSLLQSTISPAALSDWAVEQKCPALGVTDDNMMFAALEISETLAGVGVQPISGLTLRVAGEPSEPSGELALLACDRRGYTNLLHLSSEMSSESSIAAGDGVSFELLSGHSAGLICLTGGENGAAALLASSGSGEELRQYLSRLQGLFGDRLYVELQRHEEVSPRWEASLIEAAYALGLPLVAGHDARFVRPSDHGAQQILMCIGSGSTVDDPARPRCHRSQYLRPADEMQRLFANIPEALGNTVEIAQRCQFRPEPHQPLLPRFLAEGMDEAKELASKARSGLEKRIRSGPIYASEEDYYRRIEYETGVIEKMGFAGYFLIVADFVGWALEQGIPVGPGRGSGAGSLVAYALRITDLDPLRFGLLFERFLNPDRVSMPDFDIDFCQERRGEVIDYVRKKYGSERVAHIISFGTLQARAVLRDVGRVMQLPFGQVDRLAKLVPFNPAHPPSLASALETEPELAQARSDNSEIARLIDTALALEGLHRNASTHAAGLVIADRPIRELVPLYKDPKAEIHATQFSMKWAEAAGLVKFDFLGLKTLTILARVEAMLRADGKDWGDSYFTLDDSKAYELLASGHGLGVFQMESEGMRDTLRKLGPDRIEDVIALISLYRPGPMKNIDIFVACKRKDRQPDYLHPELKPVLEETYGVIVYQEQVMQIAQIMAGYSLAEADLLRRAMGKKKPLEMAQQKGRFVSGAMARGISEARAEYVFDLVDEFAGYGFNKSHAAAYAVLSYRTAWAKAYYPAKFLAASMSLDMHNTDRLFRLVREARRLGIMLVAPDIARSCAEFVAEEGKIIYALGALKGIGMGVARSLQQVRQHRPFTGLADLAERVDPAHFGRRSFETLAAAGAFDAMEPNRAKIFAGAGRLAAISAAAGAERQSGQTGLFGDKPEACLVGLPEVEPWSQNDLLDHERSAMGFHLSRHPLALLAERDSNIIMADRLEERPTDSVFTMIGILAKYKEKTSAAGARYGLAEMSDPSGHYEIFIPPELLAAEASLLKDRASLRLRVKNRRRDDRNRLVAENIQPLAISDLPVPILDLPVRDIAILPLLAADLQEAGDSGDLHELLLSIELPGGAGVKLSIGSYKLQQAQKERLQAW